MEIYDIGQDGPADFFNLNNYIMQSAIFVIWWMHNIIRSGDAYMRQLTISS